MEKESPQIGLYGGSFDPPHIAHVLVAGWVLSLGKVDEVWVIPSGGHPFGKSLAPFADRFEMCRRAFACFGDRVRLLDIEKEPQTHYTIQTLRRLAELYPDYRWRWIMGSDTLDDAPKWREFDEVMRLAPPLVIPRRGYRLRGARMHGQARGEGPGADFTLPDVSSTLIRRKLRERRLDDLAGLVPSTVLQWIHDRSLYDLNS